jgi:hypothetical protein
LDDALLQLVNGEPLVLVHVEEIPHLSAHQLLIFRIKGTVMGFRSLSTFTIDAP